MSTELLLIGASHHTAGIDVRGRLAAACGQGPGTTTALAAACPALREVLVLSTCHRFEIYAATADVECGAAELRSVLEDHLRDRDALEHLVVASGEAALRHLCRVTCGLESVVVGEAEIAGQVRRAAMTAKSAGTLGPVLGQALAGAWAASGRARSETRIGAGVMSVSNAAVSLLEQRLAPLGARAVLVVGAGQAGRQVLDRLAKRGARRLVIASRSAHHASEAAARTGAVAVGLEGITRVLPDVDAVIAATVSDRYVLDARAVESLQSSRPSHWIDLSVPRVLDPELGRLDGVTLQTVDDLGDIVRASLTRRLQEVPKVEAIVTDEVRRSWARIGLRSARAYA